MRLNMQSQRGVSMVEVLIAIIVFSAGLLGLLAAASLSIRTNSDAYASTQVVNIAEYLFGAMRRNSLGVFNLQYNGAIAAIDVHSGAPTLTRTCTSACTSAAQATDDIRQTALLMGQNLPPGATARVTCTPPLVFPSIAGLAGPGTRAPYVGSCNFTITWAIDRVGTTATRTWVFQP
jgi:type IV pilus assembly protein PilV